MSAGKATRVYRVDIQPLIEVRQLEIDVVSPEYTGLKPRVFAKPEISVLERSDVTVSIELNHPLQVARLETGAEGIKVFGSTRLKQVKIDRDGRSSCRPKS